MTRSRGLGDVYKRQGSDLDPFFLFFHSNLVHDYHMDRDYYLDVADFLGREVSPELRDFRDGPWVWNDRTLGLGVDQMSEEIVAKYDAGVRSMDRELEKVLEAIDFDSTIVVFVSDHGEGLSSKMLSNQVKQFFKAHDGTTMDLSLIHI